MAAWIALASVISSGIVAILGLWLTYRSGKDQRDHEAQLAYEERAWEKKTDGLFEVIRIARGLVDVLDARSEARRDTIALRVPRARDQLEELVPVVEAYGSDGCRHAFGELRWLLGEGNKDHLLNYRIQEIRQRKEKAIDDQDFPAAANARDEERQLIRQAAEALGIDRDDLRTKAHALIDTARASVRGET